MAIKNNPITTAQKTRIARTKKVLKAPSIYLLINEYSITVTEVNVVGLTKIILYFLLFDKD